MHHSEMQHNEMQHSEMHHSEMQHSEMQHSKMQHSEMQAVCVWPQMEGWAKGKKRGSEQSRALLHLCHTPRRLRLVQTFHLQKILLSGLHC